MTLLRRFFADDAGATAVEYAILGMVIAVAIVAAVQSVGSNVSTIFSETGAGLK